MHRVKDFVAFCLFGLSLLPLPLWAQWKVPLNPTEWKVVRTERFLIHYQKGSYLTAVEAARIAQSEAPRIESLLRHRLHHRIKIFLYPSDQDFQSNSILPGIPSESTGGFTDFARHRVVLPFNGNYQDLRHVLVHEIVHAYQFDIADDTNPGIFPLWLMEGMCEYFSLGWDAQTDARIRDLMIHGRMPGLWELHTGQANPYMNYKGGQAIMEFIAQRWGPQRIGFFYKELISLRDLELAFESAFGMSAASFDLEWKKYLAQKYAVVLEENKKADPRFSDQTFRYVDGLGFQLRPVFSPDGKYFAYLSYDGIFPALFLQRVGQPGMDESKRNERMVLLRQLRSSDFEQWYPLTNRISFGPQNTLIVATRSSGKPGIAQVSIKDGDMVRFIPLPFDMVHFPVFVPPSDDETEESILFTGVVQGVSDLYRLDWQSGHLSRLTRDGFYESDPMDMDGCVYFVSDAPATASSAPGTYAPSAQRNRNLFRKCGDGAATKITDLQGDVSRPAPGKECSLYFLSNHEGVRNVYRLPDACRRSRPASARDLDRITASSTEVLSLDSGRQKSDSPGTQPIGDPSLLLSRLEEGALEVRMVEPEDGQLNTERSASVPTFLPSNYSLDPLLPNGAMSVESYTADYDPLLRLSRPPILFITGASDSEGNTSVAGAAYFALADDSGFHDLEGLITYQDRPSNLNVDLRYGYSRWRTKFYTGLYSSRGTFALFSFLDFSLNQLLYNPYFRLIDQQSTGAYAAFYYPLHKFGAVSATYEVAREEKIFAQPEPEQRDREDVFQNRQSFTLQYTFDNTVNSVYGPLDGQALRLSYSVPIRPSGTERNVFVTGAEYRFYHLFDDYSLFAFRLLGARVSGGDAENYPLSVGGYYTIRGYDFLEFEGRNAFVVNLEYRFTFIQQLIFGVPVRWSPGLVRGSIFLDAGAAFDDYKRFQAFDGDVGVTRDLNVSFGVGLHWSNFLWFLFPGALMKIEWATPYDGKRSLPLSQWQGRFSVGFSF